jgi:DNA polymerase-3 subunit beta
MTFTCESATLAKALRDIVAIVPRGHSMEILSNVLIEAADGEVRVTTTNLEMMATRTIKADVSEPASVTVDANRFSSVVASLPAGSQMKATAGDRLTVVAGRSRFSFGTLRATSYPPMPFKLDGGVEFEAGDDFLRALAIVRHAVGTDETQSSICGILLEWNAGTFNVVAADGKRLAVATVGQVSGKDFRATLPTGLADMVMKLGEGTDRTIMVRVSDRAAQFDFGDTVLTGKLIDLPYPNYARAIPTSFLRTIKADGALLVAALRRVSLVIDDKSRRIHVTATPGTVTMANAGQNEGSEDVSCDYDGDKHVMWFNNQLLREAIAALDASDIVIGMNDQRGPIKITSPSREGVTMVVVPQFEGAK